MPTLLERVSQRKLWGGQSTIWEQDALRYALVGASTSYDDKESIEHDFVSYFLQAIQGNPVVFGATERRRQVFSQAAFMWQTLQNGRQSGLTSDPQLDLLRTPWPGGSLPKLLGRMENDVTGAGNCYLTVVDDAGRIGNLAKRSPTRRIARMRPDWVTIIVGVPNQPNADIWDVRARVLSYEYRSPRTGEVLTLLPDEVVHYAPIPDGLARFRGMSWLTPVLIEVLADKAATEHKLIFFKNGAVHSMVLKYPPNTSATLLKEYKKIYDAEYKGVSNHYKVFHVAGADPVPITASFHDLELKATQGAGETRIAVDSGVPAVILGISEGLQGSTLNQGNFGAARRLFVDTTIRDLWSVAAPALQVLFTPPQGNQRLWYDDRDIPFLREDAADNAKIKTQDAQTIKTLVDSGCDWDAAVEYVRTGDFAKLKGKQVEKPVQVQARDTGDASPAQQTNGSRRDADQVETGARR